MGDLQKEVGDGSHGVLDRNIQTIRQSQGGHG